jgi:hypothetical protein
VRHGDWIETYTGRRFWPLDPMPEDVCIEDIAHSLSNQCRFAGHSRGFYSVGEHCVLMAQAAPAKCQLEALMHDASEAYLLDFPKPLKHMPAMSAYREAHARCMDVISKALGCDYSKCKKTIEILDMSMLAAEAKVLMRREEFERESSSPEWGPVWAEEMLARPIDVKLQGWSPKESEWQFLKAYAQYVSARNNGESR